MTAGNFENDSLAMNECTSVWLPAIRTAFLSYGRHFRKFKNQKCAGNEGTDWSSAQMSFLLFYLPGVAALHLLLFSHFWYQMTGVN